MTRAPASGPRLLADDSLFFKLVRVVNLTARPFVETLSRQHQLSLNEWRVMVVLASHPGVAAHEVAEITGLDKMSVSRALAALERRRRVQRRFAGRRLARVQIAGAMQRHRRSDFPRLRGLLPAGTRSRAGGAFAAHAYHV